MRHLDAYGVLQAGGWDPRNARVLAIARENVAAVLVDSSGDGVAVDPDGVADDAADTGLIRWKLHRANPHEPAAEVPG
jgi:hypothetical protein